MGAFLRTFCDRILRDFKFIVDSRCSPQNRWILTCSHGSQNTSSATSCWNNSARKGIHWSQLNDLYSSSSIWMYEGRVCLSSFLVLEGWSCHLVCNTIQTLCDSQTCESHCTWCIWSPVFYMRKWCVPISSNSCTRELLGSCSLPGW